MPLRTLPLLLLATCAPLCACGPIFFAQVEEPELCKTVSAAFSAAAAAVRSGESVSVELDVRSELDAFQRADTSTQLRLLYVRFEALRGIQDFDFVDTAVIKVVGTTTPECNLPALVSYQRDPAASPQSNLTFPGPDLLDLAGCLSAEKVTLETDFGGSLPTNDWSMSVKACLSGKARINYLGGKGK